MTPQGPLLYLQKPATANERGCWQQTTMSPIRILQSHLILSVDSGLGRSK